MPKPNQSLLLICLIPFDQRLQHPKQARLFCAGMMAIMGRKLLIMQKKGNVSIGQHCSCYERCLQAFHGKVQAILASRQFAKRHTVSMVFLKDPGNASRIQWILSKWAAKVSHVCDLVETLGMSCRLHAVLAQEPALRDCRGELSKSPFPWDQQDSNQRESKEAHAMTNAVKHAFHLVDQEILDRCRQEQGRDGSCALVVLRVGGESSHQLPLEHGTFC